jgi:O-antigen/teichoic acid export membrane protein
MSSRLPTADSLLTRRAFSLGTANAIDYALQFLIPIVLTRALDAGDFGRYRLLWLAVSTLMVAPLFMPQSLYYFLPRSDRPTQRLYINQTLLFLAAVGSLAAWTVSEWNPFLPQAIAGIARGEVPLVPAFVLVWIVASLLDVLPTVDERVQWQARAIVGLSLLRSVALGAVAAITHDFGAVLWTLLAFVGVKLAVLVAYIASTHGLGGPLPTRSTFSKQFRHAAPFGFAGTFYGLRAQADQWVAAALFPVHVFASFSIATVLGPMVNLFRQSVNHVFLPSMSRLHSQGDVREMLALNSRANSVVALLVYPLLAFVFAFAEPLVTLVYTSTYVDAAPVLRLYIAGLVAFVIELNSVMLLLNQGGFAMRVNAATLALSVPLSVWGALTWGLPGAALGSVAMIQVERIAVLLRIARITGQPLARLQDWPRLGAVLGASALGATVAGLVARSWGLAPFATLAAGSAVMALAYPAALCLSGQRSLITGLFHPLPATEAAPSGNP